MLQYLWLQNSEIAWAVQKSVWLTVRLPPVVTPADLQESGSPLCTDHNVRTKLSCVAFKHNFKKTSRLTERITQMMLSGLCQQWCGYEKTGESGENSMTVKVREK